jgi:diguanylate cyclase (GGDEF)-like protein/PAS domain S-box-containing protein
MKKTKRYDFLIIFGFTFLIVFIIVISLLGAFGLNKTTIFQKTYSNSFEKLVETEKAEADLIAVHRAMKDVALSRNYLQLTVAIKDVDNYNAQIEEYFTTMAKINPNDVFLTDVINAYSDWVPIRATTIELAKNGQYEQAAENTRTAGADQVNVVSSKMQLLIDHEKAEAEKGYQSSLSTSNFLLNQLLWLTLLAILIAISISIYVRHKVFKYQTLLHEEKEKLQITFDSIGDGVITTDINRNVVNLNKVAEEFTGWKTENAIGKPFAEVFCITSAITGKRAKDPVEEVLLTNGICLLENHTVLTSKDGIKRHISDSAAPIKDENDITTGVVMIFRDVTERKLAEDALKKSESRLKITQSIANVGNWEVDLNINRVWASHQAFKIYGIMQESSHLSFKTIQDIVCKEDRPMMDEAFRLLLEKDETYDVVFKIIRKDDAQQRTLHSIAVIERDENGKPIKMLGTIQDITESKKREQEILYLNNHDVLTGLYNRAFFEEESKRLNNERQLPISVIMGDINGLKLINDAFGHAEGDKLLTGIAKILSSCCRSEDIVARTGGDEFCILLPQTSSETAQTICRRIYKICENYEDKIDKEIFYLSISLGYATKEDSGQPIESIIKLAEEQMYKQKLLERKSMHSSIMSSIKATMMERSPLTEEHEERLVQLSMMVGRALELSDLQLNELELLSTLHDIGKMSINDNILNKSEKLNDEEWSEIRKHPEVGYRIANVSPELVFIADFILCHHERWDGKGYPQGLKGESIPLLSRIISVVDSYDAMTQDRPYRKAMPTAAAIEEIAKNAGTQFDPDIAKVFIEKILDT